MTAAARITHAAALVAAVNRRLLAEKCDEYILTDDGDGWVSLNYKGSGIVSLDASLFLPNTLFHTVTDIIRACLLHWAAEVTAGVTA